MTDQPASRSERRVCRGRRLDGDWEIWLSDSPEEALKFRGRWHSFLVYLALRSAPKQPARTWRERRHA